MTELKRSLDRALSGMEFSPDNRRRVRLAIYSKRRTAHVVGQEVPAAIDRRSIGVKTDAPAKSPEVLQTRRRLSTVLVFALVAALILAGVAVAAVVTRIASEDFSGEKAEFPEVFASEDPGRLYEFGCQFQGVPEGTQEIRLRPVYSISGERPEEDVVLKMPDTPAE